MKVSKVCKKADELQQKPRNKRADDTYPDSEQGNWNDLRGSREIAELFEAGLRRRSAE